MCTQASETSMKMTISYERLAKEKSKDEITEARDASNMDNLYLIYPRNDVRISCEKMELLFVG